MHAVVVFGSFISAALGFSEQYSILAKRRRWSSRSRPPPPLLLLFFLFFPSFFLFPLFFTSVFLKKVHQHQKKAQKTSQVDQMGVD